MSKQEFKSGCGFRSWHNPGKSVVPGIISALVMPRVADGSDMLVVW
jgi:hypothetical protein